MPRITNPDGSQVVAERNLTLGQESFKRIDDGTESLAVDGRASGAITTIWNGTGAGDTGGDWTRTGDAGPVESTEAARSGTNGLDTGVMGNDHELFFTDAADFDPENFAELSFWIQPKQFPGNGEIRVKWQTVAGSNKGGTLKVEDYVTNLDLDVWQRVTLPIADFNINENDDVGRLRFEFHNDPQRHFIDDIQLQSSGGDGPYTFRIAAPNNTQRLIVSQMTMVLTGDEAGWSSASFVNITALTNGLLLRQRRLSDSEVFWSINAKDNIDLFGRFHPNDDITFSDGTMLVGFILDPRKASITITDDEVLELIVRDDLSLLPSARAYLLYGVENL